jgi:hypothetical protein
MKGKRKEILARVFDASMCEPMAEELLKNNLHEVLYDNCRTEGFSN